MRFSIEELYYQFGKFDKVVGISFNRDSESYRTFGDFIVGKLIYTAKDRTEIENRLQLNTIPRTEGFQRFQENIQKLEETKIADLEKNGFKCSDILEVLHFNAPSNNEFKNTETRELPEPIKIKIDPSHSGEELANVILYFSNSLIKSNYLLCPFEWEEYYGALWYKYADSLPENFKKENFFKEGTTDLKDEIKFQYLNIKFESDELTIENEKDEYLTLFNSRLKNRHEIIKNELTRASEKVKELPKKYSEEFKYVYSLSFFFKPERLTNVRFPVYLDFSRFIHIYLGHVAETLIGERHETNTLFQYKLKDIERLIKTVLKKIEPELQKHFIDKPESDFHRQGSRSVYYNGDYYRIHIDKNGRLMTFFKNN